MFKFNDILLIFCILFVIYYNNVNSKTDIYIEIENYLAKSYKLRLR